MTARFRFDRAWAVVLLILVVAGCMPGDADRMSLQALIDAAAVAGGGTVVVPAGVHRSPALRLKTGVTLHLEKGAVLKAGTNDVDYAATDGHAFILAEGADRVAIEGGGVVDGGGEAFPSGSLEVLQQPRLVWFRDCRDVRVENVTLRNGRRWTCFLDRCDGVLVRGVRIRSVLHKCCDGIDLECRNALVENCTVETHDDAICFKARCSDYTVENVEVRNCTLASGCSLIKVGTETLGRLRNLNIHDCRCARLKEDMSEDRGSWPEFAALGLPKTPFAYAGISLQVLDGGILEDVTVRDIDLGASALVPVFVRFGRRTKRIVPGASALRRVTIENVKGRGLSPIGCSVTGVPGLRPADITLRNVDLVLRSDVAARAEPVPELEKGGAYVGMFGGVLPAWGFYLRHADRITFENCRIRPSGPEARPCFVEEDCTAIVGADASVSGQARRKGL